MKLLCIDNCIRDLNGVITTSSLVVGKIYECDLIFYNVDDRNPYTKEAVEWEKNKVTIEGEGFSEFDWYPTSCFQRMEEVRQDKLNQLGIK